MTINIIFGGFAGGGMTKLARKKHLQEALTLFSEKMKTHKPSSTLEIVFSSSNHERIDPKHDDPMIISAVIVNAEVERFFVDQKSSAYIIFQDTFDKLGLKNFDLQAYEEELIEFSNVKVHPDGYVTFHLTLRTQPRTLTVKLDFLVVDCPSAYNVILGRLTLNKIEGIISTACLAMKFFTNKGEIAIVKANQAVDHRCDNASLEIKMRERKSLQVAPAFQVQVMIVNQDARRCQEMKRLELDGELEVVYIGPKSDQSA